MRLRHGFGGNSKRAADASKQMKFIFIIQIDSRRFVLDFYLLSLSSAKWIDHDFTFTFKRDIHFFHE